jgi:nucleoside-diphosphate-sugar epimerase
VLSCDIRDLKQVQGVVQQVQPDYVIHLAAKSFTADSDILGFYESNVLGTENLLKALAKQSKSLQKVILASSASVYGNQAINTLDETLCPQPNGHYGISKLAMEMIAKPYENQLPLIVTRPFNYTGVGQAEHFIIPKLVHHYKLKKETLELGNIDVSREFNDIQDVCDWYLQLLQNPTDKGVVNLCTGRLINLRQVLSLLEGLTAHAPKLVFNENFARKNEIVCLSGNPQKLQQWISVTALTPFETTLKNMLEH